VLRGVVDPEADLVTASRRGYVGMKRFVRRFETGMRPLLVAVVALIAGAGAGAASAHVIDARTNVTIARVPGGKIDPGRRVVVYGSLRSAAATCRGRKFIELRERRRGVDPVLARDRTDADGEYRFVLRPRRDLVVYARFAGSLVSSYGHRHRCRSDNSRAIRIALR
jgi:hypothetical protein